MFVVRKKFACTVNKHSLYLKLVARLSQIVLPVLGHFDYRNHEKVACPNFCCIVAVMVRASALSLPSATGPGRVVCDLSVGCSIHETCEVKGYIKWLITQKDLLETSFRKERSILSTIPIT